MRRHLSGRDAFSWVPKCRTDVVFTRFSTQTTQHQGTASIRISSKLQYSGLSQIHVSDAYPAFKGENLHSPHGHADTPPPFLYFHPFLALHLISITFPQYLSMIYMPISSLHCTTRDCSARKVNPSSMSKRLSITRFVYTTSRRY